MMPTNVTKTVGAMMAALHLSILFVGGANAQNVSDEVRAALDSEEFPVSVNTVPVTLNDFVTAETHLMMVNAVDLLDSLGKWAHVRGLTSLEHQNVVRMNRDTL